MRLGSSLAALALFATLGCSAEAPSAPQRKTFETLEDWKTAPSLGLDKPRIVVRPRAPLLFGPDGCYPLAADAGRKYLGTDVIISDEEKHAIDRSLDVVQNIASLSKEAIDIAKASSVYTLDGVDPGLCVPNVRGYKPPPYDMLEFHFGTERPWVEKPLDAGFSWKTWKYPKGGIPDYCTISIALSDAVVGSTRVSVKQSASNYPSLTDVDAMLCVLRGAAASAGYLGALELTPEDLELDSRDPRPRTVEEVNVAILKIMGKFEYLILGY